MRRVSTSYGASDDGIAVVSMLQLISYFTMPGQQPKHGLIALINNGEEDGLWGSRVFGYSPLLPFVDRFLNLEGAGVGSQAMLFRTTDQHVTSAYRGMPHPFGTSVSSDGFKLGLISSDTDYSVFTRIYGMRGLDVAFYKPRARYHSNQDDAGHASIPSMWHMLESALHTVDALVSEPLLDEILTTSVWFDTFALSFAIVSLKSMFNIGLAMLIITPVIIAATSVFLWKADRYYFFAGKFKERRRSSRTVNG